MPKCFSGLEILLLLCKSVCEYLQAGMLVFYKGDSHLLVLIALLNVILPILFFFFFLKCFRFFFSFSAS